MASGFFAQAELAQQDGQKRATDFNTALSWSDADESATIFALDLLVMEQTSYYFRNHDIGSKFDFKHGLLAERPAVIETFAKYDRAAQATVIHILMQFDLVKDEYFHFIYQQYLLSKSKAVREAAQNALLASPPEIVKARVLPDIGAVAAMLSQFDIIPVRRPAVLEHVDQLVLAPVERPHAGIVFDPDA